MISNVTVTGLGQLLSYLIFLPDNTVHATHIKCPVLLLHAKDDTLIPISHAVKLTDVVNEANPNNATLTQSHGGHNFDVSNHVEDITEFIQSINQTKR